MECNWQYKNKLGRLKFLRPIMNNILKTQGFSLYITCGWFSYVDMLDSSRQTISNWADVGLIESPIWL